MRIKHEIRKASGEEILFSLVQTVFRYNLRSCPTLHLNNNSLSSPVCRLVRVSSGEIEKLTPLIIQAARDFRANPRDLVVVERLQTIGREWASKVHVLSGAVDKIVQPWSAAASKLALAASSGDAEQLRKQVKICLKCYIETNSKTTAL